MHDLRRIIEQNTAADAEKTALNLKTATAVRPPAGVGLRTSLNDRAEVDSPRSGKQSNGSAPDGYASEHAEQVNPLSDARAIDQSSFTGKKAYSLALEVQYSMPEEARRSQTSNRTPQQGILTSKDMKSYDAQFFSSIKLTQQMREMQDQKSSLSNQRSSGKLPIVDSDEYGFAAPASVKNSKLTMEHGRNSEMLNAHTIHHFWRGAGNLRIRNGQSFQQSGHLELSAGKKRHSKKPSFSSKILDKLPSRDGNSLSESHSFRAGQYEVPCKSLRYDEYGSDSDSGELRENYDELNLVFDCEKKQWKHPYLRQEQLFAELRDSRRSAEITNLHRNYSRQYPGSAGEQAPVLTVGALNKIFTSLDEVDIWEMPGSPRGPLDGEATVERDDVHSGIASQRLSVHRSMEHDGKGQVVRSSKQFSSPNNRSSVEMAANMSDYTQI